MSAEIHTLDLETSVGIWVVEYTFTPAVPGIMYSEHPPIPAEVELVSVKYRAEVAGTVTLSGDLIPYLKDRNKAYITEQCYKKHMEQLIEQENREICNP